MDYLQFREEYPAFIYEEFAWEIRNDQLHTQFSYRTPPDHAFVHRVIFESMGASAPNRAIDNLVFHIGLAEMPSYWKATCSPRVEVRAGQLSPKQAHWWRRLFIGGMGEYFYKNDIDFTQDGFLDITSHGNRAVGEFAEFNNTGAVLVPIGGGKDSAVSAEILRQNYPIQCLLINPTPAARSVASLAGCEAPIIVRRTIDPYLLQLNQQGFLNGHIPFSASIAFISLLVAALGQHKYMAVSNERSSNEGNVHYLGHEINHQYSKSLEFETDFNRYVHAFITRDMTYFSFLRPLYELQIARLFSKMPQYFPVFRSCNQAQKSNSWCGHCPKCLSIALTLMPWTDRATIEGIFGFNPLVDPDNQEVLRQMKGERENKPFECVTTFEEAQIAQEMLERGMTARVQSFLERWLDNPNMPEEFSRILRQAYVA